MLQQQIKRFATGRPPQGMWPTREQRRAHSLFHNMGFRHVPRRQNPTLGGVIEVITQPLYDQVSFAQGAAFAKTILFQTPKGQGGKTLAQTNMTQAGILPNPQRFTIYAICVLISNNTIPADMFNLVTNVSFELDINTKPYFQGPLVTLPAGRGFRLDSIANVGQAVAACGFIDAYSTTNGVPDPRAVYTLDAPITIEQGEQFQVVLNPETAFNLTANSTNPAGVGTTITIFLDGNLERGAS